METLILILLFTFVGSIVSLFGGVLLLYWKKRPIDKFGHFLVSFAAGAMLAAAFFDLMPEASGFISIQPLVLWVFVGIVFFFVVEKFLHWRHCHEKGCEIHGINSAIIIFGDAIHNFIDGVIIAATFLINIPLGIITSIAVFMHEVPQEIGNFGVLAYLKMKRKKIILINLGTAALAFAGAFVTFFLAPLIQPVLPLLIALAAGGFIYIALSDLVPETHKAQCRKHIVYHTLLFFLGILMIYGAILLFE